MKHLEREQGIEAILDLSELHLFPKKRYEAEKEWERASDEQKREILDLHKQVFPSKYCLTTDNI